MNNLRKLFYGLILCLIILIAASFISKYIHIGRVTLAIITGIIVGNFIKPSEKFQPGISFSEKKLLSFAIALMGINLDFALIEQLGLKSVFLIIVALSVTLITSLILSKVFKFNKTFGLLLGIGNGVCGSSAIAATEQIIGAKEEEVGISIAIINFLGTIGIFLMPLLISHILTFPEINSGILIGNTLQAVGQVTAAGFSISQTTGQTATIVKMGRILMLTPLIFILIFSFAKQNKDKKDTIKGKVNFPPFVLGFIVFSIIATLKILPEEYVHFISKTSHYSLIMAMAAIGLRITFKNIFDSGKTALIIASIIFFVQIVFNILAVSVIY